jgi:hypothetical protein
MKFRPQVTVSSNGLTVKALSSKFKAAQEGVQSTKTAFDDLNSAIQLEMRQTWLNSEEIAMESQGEYLKIYDVQLEKSKFLVHPSGQMGLRGSIGSTISCRNVLITFS